MILARENPFRIAEVKRFRYLLSEQGWQTLYGDWCASGCRGAIVGPHGSGKTTLLEDFAKRFGERFSSVLFWRFNRGDRKIPRQLWSQLSTVAAPLLLLDGLEQLSRAEQFRLRFRTRKLPGILVTTHTPVFYPTVLTCQSRFAVLEQMVRQLLVGHFQPTTSDLTAIFSRHHGNIREALLELYDSYGAQAYCTATLDSLNETLVSSGS